METTNALGPSLCALFSSGVKICRQLVRTPMVRQKTGPRSVLSCSWNRHSKSSIAGGTVPRPVQGFSKSSTISKRRSCRARPRNMADRS